MRRNILNSTLALALAGILAGAIAGCGSSASGSGSSNSSSSSSSPVTAAGSTTADAAETDSDTQERKNIKLGVCGSISVDLWQPAKKTLADEGIDLDIVDFSDYTLPNNALSSGEIDINQFQHRLFFENEVKEHGYKLTPIGYSYIIPLNLYSLKVKSPDEIKDGDVVAIPDDLTNGGRALKVLQSAGLIKIRDDADINPTLDDIEKYNVDIKIEELAGDTIPSALQDVTAAIINGNYVIDFGMSTDDAIFKDTSLDDDHYWGLIVVRTEDLQDQDKVDTFEKIVKAYQSQATADAYINDYGGYNIPVGWDQDLISQYKKDT